MRTDHFTRRAFGVGAASLLAWPAIASAAEGAAMDMSGVHDFDFQTGDWRVRHRYLRRSAAGDAWREVDSTCRVRPLEGGWGNLEEFVIDAPSGVTQAVGLRAYDPSTGLWAAWWLDGRAPSDPIDPPLKGRFRDGVGTFFSDTVIDGRPTRVRVIWSRITARSARWEQAYSTDGGESFETNWIMSFERATSPLAPPPSAPPAPGLHDFDFQVGDWAVQHRRRPPGGSEWISFDGTCSNRPLLGGAGNIEEQWLNAPRGAYRAVGLRSFNPTTGTWASRWLDQRYPTGPVDPPVVGRLQDGMIDSFSDYEADGKSMRVRYRWSEITSTTAKWEQAQSADAGATWDLDWVMQFTRRA